MVIEVGVRITSVPRTIDPKSRDGYTTVHVTTGRTSATKATTVASPMEIRARTTTRTGYHDGPVTAMGASSDHSSSTRR